MSTQTRDAGATAPHARDDAKTPVPKIDLRRSLRPLYAATRRPAFVEVPALTCLMVDGHGDPNTSPDYRAALSALYATSYSAKFALKRAGVLDYGVMPLEGLWGSSDLADLRAANESAWNWTMFIVQPDEVTSTVLEAAKAAVAAKAPSAYLDRLRLERFTEGPAAQVLYLGPYSAEGPTIATLHDFIADQGREMTGKHHELYLGNPARSAPEKLRTIIRQPVVAR